MNIQDLLSGALGQQAQQVVAQQLGIDQQQAASAIQLALPTLLSSLSHNASKPEGADALFNALGNHNGSSLGNLGGLAQAALASGEGAKILGHIFGNRQGQVENALSQNSGLGAGQIGKLLQILAPIVMDALGGQKQQQGFEVGGLVSMLAGAATSQKQQNPQASDMLSQLFDQNKDGNMVDDALKMGAGILGKLFNK
ncbi:MAG TPA: DUF937 domain-containing protein [Chitinophagales bacterium]|nr:DUF937 domain-containing protein [Chitinophagales bacterium]HNI02110.1 DUF937 domain-containing protein [Chitinophagales bacterium]HNK89643.1 DUF937 domain-containing protein [Chitinophagales bacterium]HNL16519.1 DUF937 domain-containing protein [Chitinophagales bacterium]HNM66156.1 DUF937 domain-containing protein [Chitinophagales bacterium]